MLYEISGDFEKSYQLALIAAHLSPQDADEWLRLAEVNILCISFIQDQFIAHFYMTDLSQSRRFCSSC